MSDTLRLRPSPLSSSPMTSSTPELTAAIAATAATASPSTTPSKNTNNTTASVSATTSSTSPSSPSPNARHRPINPINTHRANTPKRNHTSTTPTSTSRTPRSPFGAWTGPPKTPLAPHFMRQTPTQVMALFVLAILLLLLFILAAARDLHGGWVPGLVDLRSTAISKSAGAGAAAGSAVRSPLQQLQQDALGQGLGQTQFPSVIPSFPRTQLAVRDDAAFQDAGERGHEAWLRMLPRGEGLVRVDEPPRHGLPRSERLRDGEGRLVGEAEVFEVAVVRELECLLVLRELVGRVGKGGPREAGDVAEWERRDARRCLDHLRQAILCHADTTLERVGGRGDGPDQSRKQSPNAIPHVDMNGAVGMRRTCKDWGHIRQWLEKNRADRDL